MACSSSLSSNVNPLFSEAARLDTFTSEVWGSYMENRFELARDGFYYLGTGRSVKCVFCAFTFNAFNGAPLHWIQHRMARPKCEFVYNETHADNIPIQPLTRFITSLRGAPLTPQREAEWYPCPVEPAAAPEDQATTSATNTDAQDDGHDTVGELLFLRSEEEQMEIALDGRDLILPLTHAALTEMMLNPSSRFRQDDLLIFLNEFREMLRDAEQRDNMDVSPTGGVGSVPNSDLSLSFQREQARRDYPKKIKVVEAAIETSSRRRYIAPAHPFYLLEIDRLNSFRNFPGKTSPESLAAAGFFYESFSDYTSCYQCGLRLCGWEEEDDAWAHHAYYSPQCNFVYLKRGHLFVDMVKTPNDPVTPLENLPTAESEGMRYTCKVCLDKEVGVCFYPCDHAITCVNCATVLDKCPICVQPIVYHSRIKLI